ncbi:hypothetical protein B0H15DRAFT_569947 [Mycena belliarum]|uniref:Uncharacterized protein n=1 Tax=Mycena belliarum TaxID=1033014 RepID=A0AAD6TWQ5_9AGAR|nr:hypothetical protein B0H15DRAFT_569947 [Mycena belliae]
MNFRSPAPLLSVEIHRAGSIEDCSAWPHEIRQIFLALDKPLPSWCTSDCLLSELHWTPPSADSCDPARQQHLSGILNLVLSTVRDIRSLVAQYGPSRSALPFVYNLLRILAHMCADKSVIITDTSFVRPRTKTPDIYELDGVAALLACHVVKISSHSESSGSSSGIASERSDPSDDLADRESESESNNESDNESDRESYSKSASEIKIKSKNKRENDDPVENNPFPSIYVPLDGHILLAQGRQECAALPFLCVADGDNIVDLMSSAACQRHIWGIPGPVVGFALSKSGVAAKLVLSWIDPATSVVHIAYSTNMTDTALGMFDFTNSFSALSFAQLILSFSADFMSINERAENGCESNSLNWRSDNVTFEDNECSQDRVTWLSDQKSSPFTPNSPAFFEDTASEEDQYSYFKNLEWMLDRKVQTIGRIRFLTNLTEEHMEINTRIDSYNEMCGLRAVKDKNALPPVDTVLAPIRETLIAQLPSASESSVLDDAHRNILFRRLSALLPATVGSYTLEAKRGNIAVYEAESRHDWDALLYHFYTQGTEILSPYVMLEHTIHYPRNDLFDEIEKESFISGMENQLDLSSQLCAQAFPAAFKLAAGDQSPDGRAKALSAAKQAFEFHSIFTALDPSKVKAMLRTRSDKEPASGKIDAILFLTVPDPSNLKAEIMDSVDAKFSMICRSKSSLAGNKTDGCDPIDAERVPKVVEKCRTTVESADPARNNTSADTVRVADSSVVDCASLEISVSAYETELPKAIQPSKSNTVSSESFILPHATAQYQTRGNPADKAACSARMDLISTVSFYAALGIENYPFYCLRTSGSQCSVIMAWKSTKKDRIYLMERNICSFDISSPGQAFQFAGFLLRLRDDREKLKALVQERLDEGVDLQKMIWWRKGTQAQECESKESSPVFNMDTLGSAIEE